MASPLAHSIAGGGLALLLLPAELWCRLVPEAVREPHSSTPSARAILAGLFGAVVLANAPDLDFVPVILFDYSQALVHRTATHSLLATLVAGLVGGIFFRRVLLVSWRTAFLMASTVYGSHLVLDLSVPDALPPAGIQLFWPISRLFVPPFPVMPMLDLDRLAAGEVWSAIRTLLFETIEVGGLVGLGLVVRAMTARRRADSFGRQLPNPPNCEPAGDDVATGVAGAKS